MHRGDKQQRLPLMAFTAAALLVLIQTGCRGGSPPVADPDPGFAGEPESYSATVVRAIDDGAEREVSVTRISRSGELRREEWREQGGSRALIWRPDQGKAFLLDLDRRIYAELPLSFGPVSEPDKDAAAPSDDPAGAIDPEAVDRALDRAPSPVRVEARLLADRTIEGHLCKVFEQRAVFPDGHVEMTITHRAIDLSGLAIRIEIVAEPQNGSEKVIISRRDVSPAVSPDEFIVPSEFKKVDKLPLK
jgi:hypothetical protein